MKKTETAYVAMNPHRCTACWECVGKCPGKAIGKTGLLLHKHVTFRNADACIGCGKCIKTCHQGVFFKPDEAGRMRKAGMGYVVRMKRLQPLAFMASAATGIGMHLAGHGAGHEAWHDWGVAHVTASLLWLLSAAAHVKRHRHWYKSLFSGKSTNRRPVTFALSALFPTVTITGILLTVCADGPGSPLGLWHYKLGILATVLSLIHAVCHK